MNVLRFVFVFVLCFEAFFLLRFKCKRIDNHSIENVVYVSIAMGNYALACNGSIDCHSTKDTHIYCTSIQFTTINHGSLLCFTSWLYFITSRFVIILMVVIGTNGQLKCTYLSRFLVSISFAHSLILFLSLIGLTLYTIGWKIIVKLPK